jgi:DNA helicase-2/ATP-dependent DNA helicase PcrA
MATAKKTAKPAAKSGAAPKAAAAKKTKTKAAEVAPAVKVAKYGAGDKVSHPMFGDGTVASVDGDKLTIDFAGGVTKQIVDYFVKAHKG